MGVCLRQHRLSLPNTEVSFNETVECSSLEMAACTICFSGGGSYDDSMRARLCHCTSRVLCNLQGLLSIQSRSQNLDYHMMVYFYANVQVP